MMRFWLSFANMLIGDDEERRAERLIKDLTRQANSLID